MLSDLGRKPFKGLNVTTWISHMHVLITEAVLFISTYSKL